MVSEANAREDHFVAPPSGRPEEPHCSESVAVPKQEAPSPGFTLTRTGHSSDWYAPASWSGRQHDPFPSRKEKLLRDLRTMSNSAFRRRQLLEQNRHFWR
jgi:hypothetical protein